MKKRLTDWFAPVVVAMATS